MEAATSRRHEAPHCDHLVQVYSQSVDLADAAATFLASGFESEEPAVVIATAAHWPLIAERLARRGWQTDTLETNELLRICDAELTLEAIMDRGGPSASTFREVVGGLLHDAAKRHPRRRVRAFGEMVDVLVRRGEQTAADIVERYWNELARQSNFTLLCGYKLDLFDPEAQQALLPQIHKSHARVLPLHDEKMFSASVERALIDILGESDAKKVQARVSAESTDAPASQLTLMWLTAHMPHAATRVLNLARNHYSGTSAA
jgi:hypothetical protein